jgi:hypothetical protein
MLQHCANLLEGDTRKPLNELGDLRAVLEIFEQGGNRNSCTHEDPRASNSLRIALDGRTC